MADSHSVEPISTHITNGSFGGCVGIAAGAAAARVAGDAPLRSSTAAANTVEVDGTRLLACFAGSPDVREQAMDLGAIDGGSRAR
jgi:hypothetical protein